MTQRRLIPTLAVSFAMVSAGAPHLMAQETPRLENPLLKLKGLMSLCESTELVSRTACTSYISGFVAGSQATQGAIAGSVVAGEVESGRVAPNDRAILSAGEKFQERSVPFCIHSTWTAEQIQRIVVRYGKAHPEAQEEASAGHVLRALAAAFPCGKATR